MFLGDNPVDVGAAQVFGDTPKATHELGKFIGNEAADFGGGRFVFVEHLKLRRECFEFYTDAVTQFLGWCGEHGALLIKPPGSLMGQRFNRRFWQCLDNDIGLAAKHHRQGNRCHHGKRG